MDVSHPFLSAQLEQLNGLSHQIFYTFVGYALRGVCFEADGWSSGEQEGVLAAGIRSVECDFRMANSSSAGIFGSCREHVLKLRSFAGQVAKATVNGDSMGFV